MKALGLVFSEDDEDVVMKALRTLQKSSSVKIYPDSPGLPGEPCTREELDQLLAEALEGPFYTREEAKAYLEL